MKLFLAGTIDNGKSDNWQKKLIEALSDTDITIYNPRRDDFPEHPKDEDVINQIRWEQDHLDDADFIIMVFQKESKSPITLLELGLYAQSKKLGVFCDRKYWRFLNVSETCRKYNIPFMANTNIDCITTVTKSMNYAFNYMNKKYEEVQSIH